MANLTGFGAMQPPPPPPAAAAVAAAASAPAASHGDPSKASVVILEHPAENKLRFR